MSRSNKEAFRRFGAGGLAVLLGLAPVGTVPAYAAPKEVPEVARVWDFSDGDEGWVYDGSWSGDSYTGGGEVSWDEEAEMLKVSVDYSGDVGNGWSQTGISLTESGGIDFSPYKVLSFDIYYDTAAFTTGQITFKPYSDNMFTDQMANFTQGVVEDAGDGKKKATLTLLCDQSATKASKPQTLMILMIGNNTDYKGDLWFDNIKLSNIKEEKYLVDSTVKPETKTVLSGNADGVTINGETISYTKEVSLTDENAEPDVVSLYQYLKAVGESGSTIYGHMEDTILKAGSSELSNSDTKDTTGSLSAVVGFDAGNLFRGFADKYNTRYPNDKLTTDNEGNIEAAARFSNEVIAEGGIITLSMHAPNFSGVPKKGGEAKHTYDGFDYLATDSYNLTGNAANQILPGGAYHEQFTAYLDMIADYANRVDGPIMFRPWHENTGSWFWWGKAFCDAETFKSIYRFTVEYLRDEKQVHNLLYLYGPGSEAATIEEYDERYPGDSYVDMVGFDTYDNNPVPDSEGYTFQKTFEEVVKLTDTFAKQHGKLFAVTETGISSPAGGIPETGNRRPEWYNEILSIITKPEYDCCYFMLWSNYSRTGSYYTPFVQEINEDGSFFGHELMDSFIDFYNKEESIFANDQKTVMDAVNQGTLTAPQIQKRTAVEGYITAPVSSSRVLETAELTARLSGGENEKISFKVQGGGQEFTVDAEREGAVAKGTLTADMLTAIGEEPSGVLSLYAGETELQKIPVLFNIKPRPDDPFLIDDFESYAGLAGLLAGSWSTNKDSGCNVELSLVKDYNYDGDYAMKFAYTETKNGWGGCELLKEANWSNCNAYQFLVVPDGLNQKTVVQINTNSGGSFEAYLQDYPEYRDATGPLLVTLPFSEFKDKNSGGALTPEAAESIRGLGFWVNAIGDSEAFAGKDTIESAIYYDAVRAGYVEDAKPTFEPVEFANVSASGDDAKAADGAAVENADGASAEASAPDDGASSNAHLMMILSGLVCFGSLVALVWMALKPKKD